VCIFVHACKHVCLELCMHTSNFFVINIYFLEEKNYWGGGRGGTGNEWMY